MANKTQPTDASIDDFLAGLSERRRDEARQLIAMMQDISGEPPVLWGPSIIGFGCVQYRLASGRIGEMGAIGFSPRKAALTIYIAEGFDRYGDLLGRLGKYRTGRSCLYLTKLADADLGVLRELVAASHRHQTEVETCSVAHLDVAPGQPGTTSR